jgi:hypothetical protein
MKRQHEETVNARHRTLQDSKHELLTTESLFSSALPITRLPAYMFSALTPYRKANIKQLFDHIQSTQSRNANCAFELNGGRIWTFVDLRNTGNCFDGIYDRASIKLESSVDAWKNQDQFRLYVALLNRALAMALRRAAVSFDRNHGRYYFQSERDVIERKFSYKSLSGKKTTRSVVHNPITRSTGVRKSFWIHLAAKLAFHRVAPRQWVLTIRPERHFTTDGVTPYTHSSIGSKITRIKSTMYNWQYFQEVQLWREFVCRAGPRLIIYQGREAIVIENRLLNGDINWLGVAGDDKEFVSQEHPEDLFSFAESRVLNEDNLDYVDESIFGDSEE